MKNVLPEGGGVCATCLIFKGIIIAIGTVAHTVICCRKREKQIVQG